MSHLHITSEGIRPLNNTRDTAYLLSSWYVYAFNGKDVHLGGSVTAHRNHPQPGTPWGIKTTRLEEMPQHWPLREGDLVRTLNTWYVLGEEAAHGDA